MTAGEVERRLFELLGAWAPEAPEPDAKLLFRVDSFRHARRAESVEGIDVGDELAAMVERAAAGPPDTRSRLSAVYRVVLPALVAACAPLMGDALAAHLADDERVMQEAERLLAKLEGESAPTKGDQTT